MAQQTILCWLFLPLGHFLRPGPRSLARRLCADYVSTSGVLDFRFLELLIVERESTPFLVGGELEVEREVQTKEPRIVDGRRR